MALETGTYISDLVATNPTASDPVAQGDDHIRLLKSTIKATFPNVNGAVSATDEQLSFVTGVTSAIQTQINQATLTSGTAVASTSGTSVDFTSIPSWVKRITISLVGVSTSGTSNPIFQIGDSGGVETSGYLGVGTFTAAAGNTGANNYTTGFGVASGLAANVIHGCIVLSLVSSSANTWAAAGTFGTSNSAASFSVAGSKSLSATLDRVRLTTEGGADTFDAGSVNILYE